MASPFLFISGRAKNRASYGGPGLKLYPMARESGMVDLEMGRSAGHERSRGVALKFPGKPS